MTHGEIELYLNEEDLKDWRRVCCMRDAIELPGVKVTIEEAAEVLKHYYEMYSQLLKILGLAEDDEFLYEIEATTGAVRKYPASYEM